MSTARGWATSTISISGFSYERPGGSPTKTVVLSLAVPDSDATTSTPQGRTGTSAVSLVARAADRAFERQPDGFAFGDLEGIEDDLLDSVLRDLDRPGEDFLATARRTP